MAGRGAESANYLVVIMEEQLAVGTKEQADVAKFALINGLARTCEKFSVKPDLLKSWIAALVSEEIPLFTKLKDMIIETARKKGIEGSARHFGVTTDLVDMLITERREREGLGFEITTSCKSLQTTEDLADMRKVTCAGVQAGDSTDPPTGPEPETTESKDQPTKYFKDNEERKVQRKYSTQDKVQYVRQFVKHSNQSVAAKELNIPTVSLNRWRDKIKQCAFQDAHADNLYASDAKGHKDKFFVDLDSELYTWLQEHTEVAGEEVDAALEREAKMRVKVDDTEPVVSRKWLKMFKAHYHIGEEPQAPDDLLP